MRPRLVLALAAWAALATLALADDGATTTRESQVEQWANETVLDLDTTFRLDALDTRGRTPLVRQDGEPAIGFTLEDLRFGWYVGDGQRVDVDLWQPLESDAAWHLQLRDYGVARFDALDWTLEHHQGPTLDESQFRYGEQEFTLTTADRVTPRITRRHVADAGPRTPGPVNGEATSYLIDVAMRGDETLSGTVYGGLTTYDDHSGRFLDLDTRTLGGKLQVAFAPSQLLQLQGTVRATHSDDLGAEQRTSAWAASYVDAAVGGDSRWRWELRGDWQQTESTLQRSWIPDQDWSAGTSLTWNDRPWKVSLGYRLAERDRFRLSPEAIQELLIDPTRTAFDRGVYVSASPQEAQFDAALRYQPDRTWRATLDYRQTHYSDLPPTGLGDVDAENPQPNAPLWYSEQTRLRGSVRYQVRPLVLVTGTYFALDRDLAERETGNRYQRWDLTWQDGSQDITWYVRGGQTEHAASTSQIGFYSNRGWLIGAGATTTLDDEKRWTLSLDGSLLDGRGHNAVDEWNGELALQYEVDDQWSVLGYWTLEAIDLQDPNNYVDTVQQVVGISARLTY